MESIVTCFPISEDEKAAIQRAAGDATIYAAEQNEIAERIFDATIYAGHAKVPVDWDSVVRQGKMKWIQSTAAGLDHCVVAPVIDSDIVVTGCSGLFSRQVAEQAVALLMALVRKLPAFFEAQRVRQYDRLPTDEVREKRVGVLGFGGNGRRIAEYLLPMCKSIVATDVFAKHLKCDGVTILEPHYTDEVFASSDIVVVSLPLLDSTRLSIGAKQFALMPRGSYFVNVGRGQLVDENALVRALESGHLAGAGTDVAFMEPLPKDSLLWDAPNLVITPHVGAQSRFRVPDTVKLFCDNLTRWKNGTPLLNLVDKRLGFPRLEHRIPFD